MSKRYSLFKGAGAASIRRLGVLLAMLLSTAWYSVSRMRMPVFIRLKHGTSLLIWEMTARITG